MRRLSGVLLAAALTLLLAPAPAPALSGPVQTLVLRAPVPKAGDFFVLGFELSIGGEGRAHRRQQVALSVRNLGRRGVFALARVRPEKGHPGRFVGELEVFHRGGGKAAAAGPGAHTSGGTFEELTLRARNERVVKEVLKANILSLADAHHLGHDEFCEPTSPFTYLLSSQIFGAAVLLSQAIPFLPAHSNLPQLADDAAWELCDYVEDEEEEEEDEASELPIATLNGFLGTHGPTYMHLTPAPQPPTPTPPYHLLFSGMWGFEGINEVKMTASFSGAYYAHGARAADSTNPVTAVKVVVPPSGSTPRQITNQLCPAQLPSAAVTTTSNPQDTLVCSGGTGIPLGQQFTLNVQTNPLPSVGMGGQLYAQQDGAYLAPFPISGP
jgi:hypothetical protein